MFTSGFEELAAYLAQVTDRTAVSRLLGISWVTVGSIVERIVARRLDGARFAKLRRIGVDEFSYRKRHRYLTIVVDHDERRVVWAGQGRSAETLGAFVEQLGPGGCARIELVTADLASSWQKALRAWVPHARVVFDRFHVERLAADAVDEVRRSEQRAAGPGAGDAKALIQGSHFAWGARPRRPCSRPPGSRPWCPGKPARLAVARRRRGNATGRGPRGVREPPSGAVRSGCRRGGGFGRPARSRPATILAAVPVVLVVGDQSHRASVSVRSRSSEALLGSLVLGVAEPEPAEGGVGVESRSRT